MEMTKLKTKRKILNKVSLIKEIYGIDIICYNDGTARPQDPAMCEKLGIYKPIKYSKLIQLAVRLSDGVA